VCREDALKVREDNRKLEQERNRLQAASVSRLKAFEAEIGCMCMRERKSARARLRAHERARKRKRLQAAFVSRLKAFEAEIGCMCLCVCACEYDEISMLTTRVGALTL